MSENIQSISQGTYTIGQTSATNFVAGNGIKIDEPSAGTVRIGNDETVLWSTDSPTTLTTFTLSENASNFEFIDVHFRLGQPTTADYVLRFLGSTNSINLVGYFNGDRTIWISSTMFTTSDHKIFNRFRYVWNIGIGQSTETGDAIRILKVVGINRINA